MTPNVSLCAKSRPDFDHKLTFDTDNALAQIVDDDVAGLGAGCDDGRCVLAICRLRHPHHRGALLLAGVGVHHVWAACR